MARQASGVGTEDSGVAHRHAAPTFASPQIHLFSPNHLTLRPEVNFGRLELLRCGRVVSSRRWPDRFAGVSWNCFDHIKNHTPGEESGGMAEEKENIVRAWGNSSGRQSGASPCLCGRAGTDRWPDVR